MAKRRLQRPRQDGRGAARRGTRPRPELFDQAVQPLPRPSQQRRSAEQPVILPLGDPLTRRPVQPGSLPRREQSRPGQRQARNTASAEQAANRQPRGARPAGTRAPHPGALPEGGTLRRRVTRGEMRRRRRRRRIIAFALFLALAALGVALSVTVLFKVEGFRLEGPEKGSEPDTGIYSQDAILAVLDIPLGENIFRFSIAEKERAMAAALPYLETIQIRRSLPGTVVVRITPAVERYAIHSAGGWAILSGRFKVLKVAPEEPSGLLRVTGAEAMSPVAGFPLALAEDALSADSAPQAAGSAPASSSSAVSSSSPEPAQSGQTWLDTLTGLLDGLERWGLSDQVVSLELGQLTEISFVYQGRVRVLLGTVNSLEYKLEWAAHLLKNENGDGLLETDKGRLDISHLRSDGSIQPVFSPGSMDE